MIFNTLTIIFTVIGLIFITLGTVGLLRFPDVHSRLHALTKADNLGLGFIVLGLALQSESVTSVIKLIFIWLIVLLAATTAAYLVAREGLRDLRQGQAQKGAS
ncbi:MAG: monovalent cation/H(+) antiporter subunit G [Phycisphaerales bacterium]|nr:MAG: monovalent cation/H(+) antiporter subunit G [Phycisphaerales bacterium]